MEFLIVVFGGLWMLVKWIREESQVAAYRAMSARHEQERKSLAPSKEEESAVYKRLNDERIEVLTECIEYLLPVYGKTTLRNTILTRDVGHGLDNWCNSPVSKQVVASFLLAKRGKYHAFSAVSHSTDYTLTNTSVIEYYHQLEKILHSAGRRDVKFYLKPWPGLDGTYSDFQGFCRQYDRFVLEKEAKDNPHCIRLWDETSETEERHIGTPMDIVMNLVGPDNNPYIKNGDIVGLDVAKIMSRDDYERSGPAYKEFIANSYGKAYHIAGENHGMFYINEAPGWLFWSGDLIKLDPPKNCIENVQSDSMEY